MKTKKLLLIAGAITAGIIIVIFLLNFYVREKAETHLSSLDPPLTYKELQVNILTNNFSLTEIDTRQKTFSLSAREAYLSGLSYYRFLFKDEIDIGELRLEEPNIRYFPQDSVGKTTSKKRSFKVSSILLKNGKFSRQDSDTSEVDLYLSFPKVEVKDFESKNETELSSYTVILDSVFMKMNAQHFIQMSYAKAQEGQVQIQDFKIVPFHSKKVFDQLIPYEKDRISLQVKNILIEDLAFDNIRDTILLENSKMKVSNAFLEIYRNKLVEDDVRRKPLYNELLRKAPIKLNFREILVENSEIIYEEQVKENREPAIIRFTDVSAQINNLNNITHKEIPQPKITARANFMRGTPVNLSWTFPVFDMNNSFTISGSFGALQGEALDPFLVPALNLQARGQIRDVKFNFYGDENILSGDFIMDYEDLKVELLTNDGSKKRNFLSSAVNLFVDNKGRQGAEDINIEVKRNKERSFWNYTWLGLQEGFMKTISKI